MIRVLAFCFMNASCIITFSVQTEAFFPLKNARTLPHGGKKVVKSICLVFMVTFMCVIMVAFFSLLVKEP